MATRCPIGFDARHLRSKKTERDMSDAPRNLVKKTSAKLNLKRETLRRLQTLSAGELGAVVAGVDVGWPYTALCKTK